MKHLVLDINICKGEVHGKTCAFSNLRKKGGMPFMNLFTLFGTIAIENAEAIDAIEQTTNKAEHSEGKISNAFGKIGNAAVTMGKIALTGFATLTAGFVALGTAAVNYNAEMEQYITSFEVMLGSEAEALSLVEDLKNKAATTPFEMSDLASTTQLLLNYGLTAEQATEKMMMLGDIAQGDAEKMNRVASAYGQMSSAGKVSLEDIKQMIEAGFNPLQEISESTGESMESLYDRISKGTISVDEITASMERSTSSGGKYFQSMEKQSQTLNGKISTLKDTVQNALGNAFISVSDVLVSDIIPSLTTMAEQYIPKLGEVVSQILPPFMEFADMALPLLMDAFEGIMPLFIQFTESAMPVLSEILQMLLPLAVQLISVLLPPLLQIMDLLLPLVTTILTPILTLLSPLIELLSPILEIVVALLEPLIKLIEIILAPLMEDLGEFAEIIDIYVTPAIQMVADAIGWLLPQAMEFAQKILGSMKENFKSNFALIKEIVGTVATWIYDNLVSKFQLAKDKVVSIFELMKNTLKTIFQVGIWGTIKGIINNVIGGIESLANNVINGVNTIIGGIDTVVSEVGDTLGLSWSIPKLDTVSLPRLYNGGVLEKGQVGLLEGSGAEAVVPLENNSKWISAVAEDMEGVAGKGTAETLRAILEEMRELNETLVDKFIEALVNGAVFRIDSREFGRMVRAVN